MKFQVAQAVQKVGGDYAFEGVVVAALHKWDRPLNGPVEDEDHERYVVQDDRGALHIYSAKNLRIRP